jgi:hypothetical protein
VLLGRDQKVAGGNLVDPVEQRAHLVPAKRHGVEDALLIPAGRYARGKQGLDLRRKIQGVPVPGVEQRLDAEAVPRREDRPAGLIPEHQSELSAQMVKALRAVILVEMQCDLAVGLRAEAVPPRFEFALGRFIAVEFAIHDDPRPLVLARDRLITRGKVDDAEPRMA